MSFLTWTQIACLHIAFYYCFKIVVFSIYHLYVREKRDDQQSQKDQTVDSTFQRLATQGFMASLIVVSTMGYMGKLEWAVLFPVNDVQARVGNVVAIIASVTMMWTHYYLGKSWSGVVSKQVDQKLVISGPYAFARHPMYAFGYLQPVGLWLMTNNWVMTTLWGIQKIFVTFRIRREDLLMVELFGEQYLKYHKSCGALLPFKPFGWDLGLSEAEAERALKNYKKKGI